MTYRMDVFKPTQDDWHGSFQLNGWCKGVKNQMLVRVSFCTISPPDRLPCYRVCAWGNDDYGLEFDCDNESQALTLFMQVIGMEFVNRLALRDLGFIPA